MIVVPCRCLDAIIKNSAHDVTIESGTITIKPGVIVRQHQGYLLSTDIY